MTTWLPVKLGAYFTLAIVEVSHYRDEIMYNPRYKTLLSFTTLIPIVLDINTNWFSVLTDVK